MLREIIIPEKSDYHLTIPEEYLNRRLEILVLPIDDDLYAEKAKKNYDIIKKTSGILKNRNIDPVSWQREIRSEWDDR